MELFPRRLVLGVVFVVLLLVLGVLGFVFLEHESLLNALLMTVLTISTASYSPNHPFDATGKVLVIILIAGGLVGLALAISAMTEYFMGGQLRSAWDRRRMDRAIERLNGHFIISGYGRVGREVARQFAEMDVPFVVVDINPEVIVRARDAGYLYMEADAADAESLAAAGLSRARGLVACADSDMNNVYVTLSARSANPDVFIVARAAYADASSKLYNAGANRVVSPYVMAGRQMAELAARPLVADYLNLLFDGKQIDVEIQEVVVRPNGSLANETIKDIHDRILHGAFVLALDRDGDRIHNVPASLTILAGDRLLVVGSGEQLRKLATIGT